MDEWINAKELAELTGLGLAMAQRTIQNRRYKKQPMIVCTKKSKKGKPTAFVLWDTTTNQPATKEAEGDCHETVSNPANPPGRPALVGRRADVAAPVAQADATPLPRRALVVVGAGQAQTSPPAQAPNVLAQAQAEILPDQELGMSNVGSEVVTDDNGNTIDVETGEIINGQLDPLSADDFERLLKIKIDNAPEKSRRSLRKYYRDQYAKNGVVPNALKPVNSGVPKCGKAGNVGRKRLLDDAIYHSFIDMVRLSANPGDIRHFCTKNHRKVTYFHQRLEREFATTIDINHLYSAVRGNAKVKEWLNQSDDGVGGEVKPPSFFISAPVGELIQMDGVEADYLAIWENDKWDMPTWIEFFDQGSRKLLAMHAYLSESSENSVDIFARFLAENRFPCLEMSIRPDNAGGFKNLKRPMKELNLRIDRPESFMFVDDYARAGKPKDKAHLESSHRAVHLFERFIIDHFQGRIAGQYQKRKQQSDGSFKTVTVTQLQISLAELNDSKLIEAYKREHNAKEHRFTDNGVQKKWRPDDKWDKALKDHDSFAWKPEHIELCRVYGHTKAVATINKEGVIQYQKQKYHVADKSLWSSHSSTKVKISFVDGKLAIFNNTDEGVYRGMAMPLLAPMHTEKAAEHKSGKVAKLKDERGYVAIAQALIDVGMVVNDSRLGKFIKDGLTLEAAHYLLEQNKEKYAKRPGLFSFNQFISDTESYLAAHKPQKIIPYAAG